MKLSGGPRLLVLLAVWAALVGMAAGQGVKRVVIVKIDGLPGYYVDRFVRQRDPETGKSVLPWIEEVFYKNGSHLENFYTRGMSLSGPSWGLLDTGQHLQIKGNVEYDRYGVRTYDYLNFFPYYTGYLRDRVADMPAVEVMDQLKIPLLMDAFPFEKRYTAQQLYQRGNSWEVIGKGVMKLYPGEPEDMVDEWTLGLNYRKATINQVEHDVVSKLRVEPDLDYFDYYDGSFDHVSHHNSDTQSRVNELKNLDRTIGRMWTAIQASSRAEETALVLVSDHGVNSEEKVYSQGFNLVKLLGSAAGGGHHVVTKRRLMLDYTVRGLNPFIPTVKTPASASYYLKGQHDDYPTALLDFDGNERSSIHLRNSDLNVLHILWQQLQRRDLDAKLRDAATAEFFRIIDAHRDAWANTISSMGEELDALHRSIERQQEIIAALPKDSPATANIPGFDQQKARLKALAAIDEDSERRYREYSRMLATLAGLKRETFDARGIKIQSIIPPGAMGDPNSIYQLQNYVVGLSAGGLILNGDGSIDRGKSFVHVNYFELLHAQSVRSNVQQKLSNRPIDFVATKIPADAFSGTSITDEKISDDPVWIFESAERQALLLAHREEDGTSAYKYVPVAGLSCDEAGKITFRLEGWREGFPLKYFEDPAFTVAAGDRQAWVQQWHPEHEWLLATHRTQYSNAIIGLNEQLDSHPVMAAAETEDEKLIRRFRVRQRQLTEADLLILANNHWNFDVRGFNPGGNHGSFFRVSTNSTLMFAGGARTGIPRGQTISEPYDSLSLVPTVLSMMGRMKGQEPNQDLRQKGFMSFPGRVIREVNGGTR